MDKNTICFEKIKLLISKRNPILYREISNITELDNISENLISEILSEMQNEFSDAGLKSNDEPNEYGLQLEDIIDFLLNKKS